LLLFLAVFITSTLAVILGAGIGWLSAGYLFVALPMGIARSAAALLTVEYLDESDLGGFFEWWMLALLGQVLVLSVVSAIALWCVETSHSHHNTDLL
jgi:hypothetical protein